MLALIVGASLLLCSHGPRRALAGDAGKKDGEAAPGAGEATEKPDADRFDASCSDASSLSQCTEYTAASMELLGREFYKSICELTAGAFSAAPCPRSDLVGTCDDGEGGVTFYYSSGELKYTAESAKASCNLLEGTWVEAAPADANRSLEKKGEDVND